MSATLAAPAIVRSGGEPAAAQALLRRAGERVRERAGEAAPPRATQAEFAARHGLAAG